LRLDEAAEILLGFPMTSVPSEVKLG